MATAPPVKRWTTRRVAACAVGLAMVAAALLSALPAAPGRSEWLLLALGVAVFALGVLGGRAGSVYRDAAFIFLNAGILLMLLEIGASLLLRVISRPPPKGHVEAAAAPAGPKTSPFYADKEWADRLWTELTELSAAWYYPHELWRRRPFRGELHNISDDGLRVTPGAACDPGAAIVYAFGGSTMWGYGVPDWGTVPAYLQAHWSRTESRPVCVLNLGQLGYTSTQSLIVLVKQLQRCEIPGFVIFYDGVNDLNYARIYGIPGAHRSLDEVALRLDTDVRPEPSGLQSLSIVRLVRRFMPQDKPRPPRFWPRPNDIASDLADGIVDVYLNNLRIVGALAREYGFGYVSFWQPHIWMGRKPLTAAEQAIRSQEDEMAGDTLAGHQQDAAHRLYNQVYASIARAAQSHHDLHYLADILDDEPSLLYLDSHHLTPEGNRIVAERMVQVIGERVPYPPAARSRSQCGSGASGASR